MKAIVLATLVMLLAAPTARAQGPTISPQKAAEVKQGRQMMITGGLLVIGGLAVLPITASASDQVGGPGVLGVDAFVVDLRTDPAQPQVVKLLPVLMGDLLGHHLVAAGCGVDLCGHFRFRGG